MTQNDSEQAKQSLVITEEQQKTLNIKLEVCSSSSELSLQKESVVHVFESLGH